MRAHPVTSFLAVTACLLCGASAGQDSRSPSGLFEGQSDIGIVVPPGTSRYNSRNQTYTLTAAGANTWYRVDDFHFLWKKAVGDLSFTADISFPPRAAGNEPDPHCKGLLMFRQTLDSGAVYVDVAVHGSGLIALQYRRERGANTQDIEINTDAVRTVRLEKRGDVFTLFGSRNGEPFRPVGASIQLQLEEPFYVGLGAVSHDVNTTEKVEFSHVTLQPPSPALRATLQSTVQTISIQDQFRRAMMIRTAPGRIRSPNWAPDRKSIYVHEDGRVRKIPYLTPDAGGVPVDIAVGKLVDCSGNFGLSPDGKSLAVSCAETKGGRHDVYVLPADGGDAPRKLTNGASGSFFHAWAPDSQRLAFTRGSAGKADIFTIPAAGGAETRLTSDTVNDGPDYTPDGKLIYFDSSRSGSTQIWRMKSDGSAAEQITDDGFLNSSPHVSPDGRSIAFLSQPANSDQGITRAVLEVMNLGDGMIRPIVEFQGSRDSFSMYGWGDATHLAFVSYQQIPDTVNAPTSDAARPAISGVSHIALYAADPAKSERFYVHDLGAIKGHDPESAQGTRYYFSPTQFVEILPLPAGSTSINRLDHVAFMTPEVERLRLYLQAKRIAVPKHTERGSDGSEWFRVVDPEGNEMEFVQPPPHLPDVPPNRLSGHIIHVGFIVHDRAREDAFFRSVLGFKPYWFGGMREDTPTWISQQVPDGTDWLEYMIVGTPEGRGIPASMKAADLGVLNHFSLGVRSAADAYTLLWNQDRLEGQTNTPKIGRDAKWQLNLLDPDGTRAEIMELHAIGKPCCSPFTADDPQ